MPFDQDRQQIAEFGTAVKLENRNQAGNEHDRAGGVVDRGEILHFNSGREQRSIGLSRTINIQEHSGAIAEAPATPWNTVALLDLPKEFWFPNGSPGIVGVKFEGVAPTDAIVAISPLTLPFSKRGHYINVPVRREWTIGVRRFTPTKYAFVI